MELQIGNRIAMLRKAKGMTQEQLALELGVSAPAISKWETDTSYPDITLLCPLARALETNVDTLLEYEENLSKEKVLEYAEYIIKIKREQGIEKAEGELQKLLCRYPNSIALKFYAVTLLTSFEVYNEKLSEDDRQKWCCQKKSLLQEIYESKNIDYLEPVISSLASLELQGNHLDEAEKLLKELPEPSDDATGLWVQLYLKKGQKEKALEILQKRLYTLLSQANTCLLLMIEKTQSDEDKIFELCSIYQKLDEIIYGGAGEYAIVLAEVYGKMGHERAAADYLKLYLESHAERFPRPNPLLFSHAVKSANSERTAIKETKEMMLRVIMADDVLSGLCDREEIQDIIHKWK